MNKIIKNYNKTMSKYDQDGIEIILWHDNKPFTIMISDTTPTYIPKYREFDYIIRKFTVFNDQDWDNIKTYSEIYFRLYDLISAKIGEGFTITDIQDDGVTIYHYSRQLGHRFDNIRIDVDKRVLNGSRKPELKLFGKGSRYKIYETLDSHQIFFMEGTKMVVNDNGLSAYDMDLPESYSTTYNSDFENNKILFYDTRPTWSQRQYIKMNNSIRNIKLKITEHFADEVDCGDNIPF